MAVVQYLMIVSTEKVEALVVLTGKYGKLG
jgi:hypothetical protein